jgi:hypothetical protein
LVGYLIFFNKLQFGFFWNFGNQRNSGSSFVKILGIKEPSKNWWSSRKNLKKPTDL